MASLPDVPEPQAKVEAAKTSATLRTATADAQGGFRLPFRPSTSEATSAVQVCMRAIVQAG